MGFPGGTAVKKCRRCRRRHVLNPWVSNPLQQSFLENSTERGGAWRATIYGVTKSWTQLKTYTHTHLRKYEYCLDIVILL